MPGRKEHLRERKRQAQTHKTKKQGRQCPQIAGDSYILKKREIEMGNNWNENLVETWSQKGFYYQRRPLKQLNCENNIIYMHSTKVNLLTIELDWDRQIKD